MDSLPPPVNPPQIDRRTAEQALAMIAWAKAHPYQPQIYRRLAPLCVEGVKCVAAIHDGIDRARRASRALAQRLPGLRPLSHCRLRAARRPGRRATRPRRRTARSDPPPEPPAAGAALAPPIDGIAILRALADAARTSQGRGLIAELSAEIRRALDGDDGADPVAVEAARLLGRLQSRRRERGGR